MNEDMEIVKGSGNVFRDFKHPRADVEQTKAILAASIISVLEDAELSTRKAEAATGINHSEFARIRRVKLDHYRKGMARHDGDTSNQLFEVLSEWNVNLKGSFLDNAIEP